MDIIIEIFLEIYMELMLLVIPQKNVTKKHKIIAKILAVAVVLFTLTLAFLGIVLIADKGNLLGIIPLSFAVIISLAQIIAGIILYKRHR